jgi:hypothetical protein
MIFGPIWKFILSRNRSISKLKLLFFLDLCHLWLILFSHIWLIIKFKTVLQVLSLVASQDQDQ